MVNTLRRSLELWSLDLKTQSMRGLNTIGEAYDATWSATGTRIAYSRLRSEKGYEVNEVAVKALDSTFALMPLVGRRVVSFALAFVNPGHVAGLTKPALAGSRVVTS